MISGLPILYHVHNYGVDSLIVVTWGGVGM